MDYPAVLRLLSLFFFSCTNQLSIIISKQLNGTGTGTYHR
jgi:hypothetical protein